MSTGVPDSSSVVEEPAVPLTQEQLLNPREQDYLNAKAYLLSQSKETSVNMYDHLVACLKKILDDEIPDACNKFSDVSKEVKRAKFTSIADTVKDKECHSTEELLAETQRNLYKCPDVKADQDTEESESVLPNLMQTSFFFEQAAVGLNREEMFRVWLAIKQLVETNPLQSVRFWGKVLGRDRNYYVAEAEFKEGEGPEAEKKEGEVLPPEDQPITSTGDLETTEEDVDEVIEDLPPKPDWKAPPTVPLEDPKSGVNKKVYFVCNVPGETWQLLPSVTPAQLSGARVIKKFFTGDLEAPVVSYPPFPGTEANYLRAQIGRISAATQVSPLGFYQFDEEEEEEEEEGGVRENYMENPEFEGIPVRELADPSMANWVHHVLHILPQGRCRWWNPAQVKEDFEDEEDEEEEKEEPDEPEPETGPPLLTPLSEDAEVNNMPAWTANISSNLVSQYAVSMVSSNLWPGAHAFAFGKTFENVYIGFGHKYQADNMNPVPLPAILLEFPSGPEITEMEDPTPEDEAAFKAAQAETAGPGEGEEEQEEEEEEEDD